MSCVSKDDILILLLSKYIRGVGTVHVLLVTVTSPFRGILQFLLIRVSLFVIFDLLSCMISFIQAIDLQVASNLLQSIKFFPIEFIQLGVDIY